MMKYFRKSLVWLLCAALPFGLFACTEPAASTDGGTSGSGTTTGGTPTTTTTTTPAPPKKTITFRDTSENGGTIGVWWWRATDARTEMKRTQYLDFLQENQVSEIYLHAAGMTDEQIATFIREAASRGMRVAWLVGDASWINNKNTSPVTNYLNYQSRAAEDAKFYALHLDVEPHQLGQFKSDRSGTMQLFAEYIGLVAGMLHDAGEKVEWDIPFWMDSDRVTMDGEEIRILEYIAKVSDTMCLMSYRDTAGSILSVSNTEITIAKQYGCKVICGVETYSAEGDAVSFMEEGKIEMYKQLKAVYSALQMKELDSFGLAIHQVVKWYSLKES